MALVSVNCDYVHHGDAEHGYGYSYAKFSGPVSGPSKEVHYHDGHNHHDVDYISKPDYHFEYGVEDPHTDVKQSRHESRSGDTVTGEYTVAQSDGKLRLVKYTADPHNGFQAEVFIDGKPLYEDQAKIQQQHTDHHQHIHNTHHHPEVSENADEEGNNGSDYEESSEY